MAVGFVLITLAVIAGSTWAFIELKSDWIRQPKIAISFFTWGVYLAMVFLRTTAGWRGRKAAIMTITVLGFRGSDLGRARAPGSHAGASHEAADHRREPQDRAGRSARAPGLPRGIPAGGAGAI